MKQLQLLFVRKIRIFQILQAIMDSYDKLTSHNDEDDDTYEEDI